MSFFACEQKRVHLIDRLVFYPIKAAALWFADYLAAMHHRPFNAYAAYTLLALLIVLMMFLLF